MIVNAGIEKIVAREGYPDKLARLILDEAGIKAELFK
jgi:dCMP deaminase